MGQSSLQNQLDNSSWYHRQRDWYDTRSGLKLSVARKNWIWLPLIIFYCAFVGLTNWTRHPLPTWDNRTCTCLLSFDTLLAKKCKWDVSGIAGVHVVLNFEQSVSVRCVIKWVLALAFNLDDANRHLSQPPTHWFCALLYLCTFA